MEDLIKLGIKEGLIRIQEGRITYVAQGKNYDFTDPEEPVRARAYIKLVLKHGYPANRLDVEVCSPRREPKLPADVVVYKDDGLENAYIVVEAKPTSKRSDLNTAKREGLGNANLLSADYLWLVCGDREIAYDVRTHPSSPKALNKYEITSIPSRYSPLSLTLTYGNNVGRRIKPIPDVEQFRRIIRNCHDVFRNIEHKVLKEAFKLISRILYTKMWDETNTPVGEYYAFQVGFGEKANEVADKIRELYKRARQREPRLFPEDLGAQEDLTLYRIAKILEEWSIFKTDLEVKGEAFQEFLDVSFRGPLGQFFTHRSLVRAMVKMVDPEDYAKVLDPACGSGGFLVYTLYHVRRKLEEKYKDSQRLFERRLLDYTHYYLYGIDVDPDIAETAVSNMIISEDAHSNIYVDDALESWKRLQRHGLEPEMFNIILTNPPLGVKEPKRHILDNFELGRGREEQVAHALFIERGLEFLSPSGFLCTIISEDVLERMEDVVDFVKRNANILAVVSLTRDAFKPYSSNAKTNILLLQKRGEGVPIVDKVFMAEAEHVGYSPSGRAISKNDLPKIVELWNGFRESLARGETIREGTISEEPLVFVINTQRIGKRIDVKFNYSFLLEDRIGKRKKKWKEAGYEIRKLKDVASLSEETINAQPEEEYLFVTIHFDGTIAERGRGHTKYLKLIRLKEGDVVLSGIDLINGAVAVVPSSLEGAVVSKEFFVVKPTEVEPEYLWFALRSKYVRDVVKALMTGVTGRHRIKWEQVAEIEIPIPDSKTLSGILCFYKEYRELIQNANEKFKKAEAKIKEVFEP